MDNKIYNQLELDYFGIIIYLLTHLDLFVYDALLLY